MAMLNLPVTYDFVDISNASPYEIAKLPLEFFQHRNWAKAIPTMNVISVLNLLAEEETKGIVAARNIDFHFMDVSMAECFNQYVSGDGVRVFLIDHLHIFDHDTWSLLFSRFSFLNRK